MNLRLLIISLLIPCLLSSSFAYDLSDYPSPFVKGSEQNSIIVIGKNSPPMDSISAINIIKGFYFLSTWKKIGTLELIDIDSDTAELHIEAAVSSTDRKIEKNGYRLEELTQEELPSLKEIKLETENKEEFEEKEKISFRIKYDGRELKVDDFTYTLEFSDNVYNLLPTRIKILDKELYLVDYEPEEHMTTGKILLEDLIPLHQTKSFDGYQLEITGINTRTESASFRLYKHDKLLIEDVIRLERPFNYEDIYIELLGTFRSVVGDYKAQIRVYQKDRRIYDGDDFDAGYEYVLKKDEISLIKKTAQLLEENDYVKFIDGTKIVFDERIDDLARWHVERLGEKRVELEEGDEIEFGSKILLEKIHKDYVDLRIDEEVYEAKIGETLTLQRQTGEFRFVEPVARLDDELSEKELYDKNLVLVGGPEANEITKLLIEKGKLKVDFNKMKPGEGIIAYLEKPLGDGDIVVVAGSDRYGTRAGSIVLSKYDYVSKLRDDLIHVRWIDSKTAEIILFKA
ncbi:MAG: S-layer protein [Candidatus Hydrothermarchaeota archaeon]